VGLERFDGLDLLDELRIPGGCEGEWDGEDGALAVDHVHGEEQWDFEARLFHGDVLEAIDVVGVGDVGDGAKAAGLDGLLELSTAGGEAVDLDELTGLFLGSHLRDEGVGARVDLGVGEARRGLRVQ
jgi:outer membrane protein assembly factor BamB